MLRILPAPGGEPDETTPVLERIAFQLKRGNDYLQRIADRLDLDAAVFDEMVENTRTRVPIAAFNPDRETHRA